MTHRCFKRYLHCIYENPQRACPHPVPRLYSKGVWCPRVLSDLCFLSCTLMPGCTLCKYLWPAETGFSAGFSTSSLLTACPVGEIFPSEAKTYMCQTKKITFAMELADINFCTLSIRFKKREVRGTPRFHFSLRSPPPPPRVGDCTTGAPSPGTE